MYQDFSTQPMHQAPLPSKKEENKADVKPMKVDEVMMGGGVSVVVKMVVERIVVVEE